MKKIKCTEEIAELVVYHNDFNRISLPEFTAQEHDMLLCILSKLKDLQGDEKIIFYPSDLRKFMSHECNNVYLNEIILKLKKNFFKADFTVLLETEKHLIYKTINLFRVFEVHEVKETGGLDFITMQVEPKFKYLIQDLVANFSVFELTEFLELKSKYSKTLYRILKQFKDTGKCTVYRNKWYLFCEFMNIGRNYTQGNIDTRILNPAVEELSNLFKNLRYEKIKDGGRGRGGKVIGIEFYFDPDCKKIVENK